MKNIFRLTTFLLFLLVANSAEAAKALSIPVQVTLVDGRTVTVKKIGDENVSFFLSEQNEMILYSYDGNYHLATPKERDSITARCQQIDEQTMKARAFVSSSSLYSLASVVPDGGERITWTRVCPSKGTVKIPVILVEFSDGVTFSFDKPAINDYFNSEEVNEKSPYETYKKFYNYGSVGGYFRYCSFGNFDPQFEIYGPYTVSYKSTDFPDDSSKTPLLQEAVQLADADIDFSRFDSDADGYVDDVIVMYAGYGAQDAGGASQLVWPQGGAYEVKTKDGNKTYRYLVCHELALSPDYFPEKRMALGTTCHEFAHNLGMVDLYPTCSFVDQTWYDNQSMEMWSLMDFGAYGMLGFAPVPFTAWERAFFGWTPPLSELTEPDDVTLLPLALGGEAKVVRNDNNAKEYYVLEAMPKSEKWCRGVVNTGLLITHVVWHYNSYDLNIVNNTHGKPRHVVLPADGKLISSYNHKQQEDIEEDIYGDTYPYLDRNHFNEYIAYTGTVDKPLTEIAKTDDGIVTFKFLGGILWGDADGDGAITMSDANLLVNYYLGTITEIPNPKAADINGDGQITMSDANAIVNLYLGAE